MMKVRVGVLVDVGKPRAGKTELSPKKVDTAKQ
jgi:hypothetical protein